MDFFPIPLVSPYCDNINRNSDFSYEEETSLTVRCAGVGPHRRHDTLKEGGEDAEVP